MTKKVILSLCVIMISLSIGCARRIKIRCTFPGCSDEFKTCMARLIETNDRLSKCTAKRQD